MKHEKSAGRGPPAWHNTCFVRGVNDTGHPGEQRRVIQRSGALVAGGTLWLCLAFCALLLLGSGCRTTKRVSDVPVGPSYSPANFTRVASLPADFQRVAILPFHHEAGEGARLDELERVFLAELIGSGRFETAPVGRNWMAATAGRQSFASHQSLPMGFVEAVAGEFSADGVLFTDLTVYSPYRPVAIGIRSRLIDRNGNTLWAIDELLDSGRPNVSRGARVFAAGQAAQAFPLDSHRSVLHSPARFGQYTAHTIYQTLPAR
jgi:hypothetical protein